MTRCAVVGGGAWGTALAHTLTQSGHQATLWAREDEVVEGVNRGHHNERFLPGILLDERLRAHTVQAAALAGCELALYVAPSHVLRQVMRAGAHALEPGAVVVVATKGIEQGSLALMTELAAEELPGHPIVALSGPSFALEVAQRQPTAIVAASANREAGAIVQRVVSTSWLRIYTNDDVVGVELAGALKNVMAVATGIAEGLGLGLNSRAGLITRGLAEMTRLGVARGAHAGTFAGLAGMGDLVLTCTGALSRNRAVGLELGGGRALAEVLAGKETVAEGILTTRSAMDLARQAGVEMPIVEAVGRILFHGCSPRDAMADLMGRDLRPERDA